MGMLNFTKRSKILGLPIGPAETDWWKVTRAGVGVAATAGGVRAAQSLKGPMTRAVTQGRQMLQRANDAVGTVQEAARGAAGSSTGIGSVLGAFKAVGSGNVGSRDPDVDGQARNMMKLRLIISEQIDVAVPRSTAYNQWTQFEDFPMVFRAVEDVEQKDDEELSWRGKVGPARRQWTSEITEQVPDERIEWTSTGGLDQRGVVTFHELDDHLTRIHVEMEYIPRGVVEKVGNLFLTVRMRVRRGLRLFKHFIELHGQETGAWRGEIDAHDTDQDEQDDTYQEDTEDQESRPPAAARKA